MTRKAFTLIELLVVVAVLALLASIVTSNLGGAREGARISNALSFQSQTHSLLGSDLVGWWNFNEGSGTTARDISGYNNHGNIVGATHVAGVPGTGGSALSFNGVGDYVDVPYSNLFDFASESFTVTSWIKPQQSDIFKVVASGGFESLATGGWVILRHTNGSMAIQTRHNDTWRYRSLPSGSSPDNTWTFITAQYDYSESRVCIAVNGQSLSCGTTGQMYDPTYTSNLFISRRTSGNYLGNYFNGLIDDVRIYSRALTAQEVQTLYAQTNDNYLAND